MIQKLKIALISFVLVAPLMAGSVSALTGKDCASGKTVKQTTAYSNGEKKTETVCAPLEDDSQPLWKDLQAIVNALAAGVGIMVVASIIIGGIQYSVAGDQPGKLEEAKKRITNALLALVAFFLTWAFLEWLIPGGVFK